MPIKSVNEATPLLFPRLYMCSFQNPFASTIYYFTLVWLHIIFIIMFFSIMSGRSMHSVLVGLVCLATASAVCCSSVGSSNNIMCLESERHALLQFKQGLVDDSNALASWKSEKDCCKWRGIECNNQTGHVTSLDFSFNYDPYLYSAEVPLSGEISPSLLELRYINYLDLSYIDFGEILIPKFIGSLSQLKKLKLTYANFSGPVPPQLGNLSNLHTLDLSSNDFEGMMIPKFIGSMSQLKELKLAYANFNGPIPPQLGNLSNLHTLDLSFNDFEGMMIPKFIGSLSQLKELKLAYANFNGPIPPQLGNLSNLHTLDLSSNDFEGMMIPKFIGSMSQLKELKLAYANFSGPVPPQLGNLSNLHTLDLYRNQVVSPENLEWLSHLSSLRYLNMSSVDLSKVVNWPPSLSKLTLLTELQLSLCNLPNVNLRSLSFINSSTSLQLLDLSYNSLNSSILYWIANVSSNFVHIDLSFNKLEGGIPKGFQNLCSLESLTLWHNQLSENFEDSVKTLSCAQNTLETLFLAENLFWGSLPDLSHFSKLRVLYLFSNQLNGSVSESVGQLSSLKWLDLSGNSLTGVITESHFLNLSRLQYLSLSGNRFSINPSSDWSPPFQLTGWLDMSSCKVGPAFPKWILTQTNLTQLYVSNAGLSGKLPNLSSTSLRYVNLSSNLFSGALPSFSPMLQHLYLSNNRFSGPLSSFCATQASHLSYLDISKNLLSGELPNCWMQFQNLISLNLGKNKLSGKIPSSLGSLQGIGILRLHDNNFSGELPSLENSTQLLMVDLGNNNLSGKIPIWIGQSLPNLVILRLRSNEFNGIIPFSLCSLAAIHVLDLSHNNISGSLPHCFDNITALADDRYHGFIVEIVWKGIEREFPNLIGMRSIDISSNYLIGEIPPSTASMTELKSLNLSRNKLTGKLPEDFGNMKMLESLDLSRNRISGRIPSGTQLQGFNASQYMGNRGLCGPPLTQSCPGEGTEIDNKEHDNDDLISLGFFISVVLGFFTGFWMVCGSLLLKTSWRYAYFRFLDNAKDWIYVKTAVYKAKVQRRLQR
ncbi:receptor-like protein EIX2 isoform X2 [Rosa chinensis]|uniref:receptor-like protein EIX2 isoform X2 n=1 Tax=Rosa chinensis TaxID=74649 RepID=UPI000D08CA24|nr:receptor-like protein EIX2 isoform X2 [Rosa chinensis]